MHFLAVVVAGTSDVLNAMMAFNGRSIRRLKVVVSTHTLHRDSNRFLYYDSDEIELHCYALQDLAAAAIFCDLARRKKNRRGRY